MARHAARARLIAAVVLCSNALMELDMGIALQVSQDIAQAGPWQIIANHAAAQLVNLA
jgi:hypothetical protein